MVCEQRIRDVEKSLGRELTKEEKEKIREKMHHVQIEEEVETPAMCA